MLAWKLTKFFMPFFKSQVSLHLNFATPFSVMTHNSTEILTETAYALDKKSPSMQNFQTFGYSNETSPNSSCHFWNHKVRFYWNIASLFSVMKDDSSAFFFSSNLIYFGQKYPIEVQFLDFWVDMSHDTKEWCKIWRKIYYLFRKWQEFGEFWYEH